VHLVGFTIEIYYDARSYKRQTSLNPVSGFEPGKLRDIAEGNIYVNMYEYISVGADLFTVPKSNSALENFYSYTFCMFCSESVPGALPQQGGAVLL
jgi:hypothetical protein